MIAEQGERIDELADEVQGLKESGLGYDDTELRQQVGALADEVSSNGVLIEDLQNTKIDKENDDYYPSMAVGLADNLVGVDVMDSEINFRRSGGGAISDGVARIETIKGNSVVWNQVIDYTLDSRTVNGISFTKNGDNSYVVSGELTSEEAYAFISSQFNQIKDHKYLLINDSDGSVFMGGYNIGGMASIGTTKIVTCGMSGLQGIALRVIATGAINTTIHPAVIDLTKMFGAGNEPTTIEEFYARKPLGIDEYAYNEGEVIHMDVQSIESVGVNQWDEEWENFIIELSGGISVDTTRIGSKNYIPIIPHSQYYVTGGRISFAEYDTDKNFIAIGDNGSFYGPNASLPISQNARYIRFFTAASYGATYKGDICINISDASINGKYFPYIKRVEELSIIRKYFPQGMKSAPTAHDAIRYNKESGKWEKVEAIGTRAYQDGDADKADVLTDGKITTLYPLAEPIVTELDEADQFKDLDYPVWNAGTEKAIAEGKSTPLSADITYGFNAPAKIKENADKIKENANEIAKLKQSSGSTTTYKTINGTSVVGSGNIDTHYPISSSTASALTIQPNTYYKWSGATLNVTLGSTDANLCEFVIELAVTGTPSITFPSSVKWANGIAPTFVSGKSYIVSIVNNLGVYAAF
jgi:hypothetical protein